MQGLDPENSDREIHVGSNTSHWEGTLRYLNSPVGMALLICTN